MSELFKKSEDKLKKTTMSDATRERLTHLKNIVTGKSAEVEKIYVDAIDAVAEEIVAIESILTQDLLLTYVQKQGVDGLKQLAHALTGFNPVAGYRLLKGSGVTLDQSLVNQLGNDFSKVFYVDSKLNNPSADKKLMDYTVQIWRTELLEHIMGLLLKIDGSQVTGGGFDDANKSLVLENMLHGWKVPVDKRHNPGYALQCAVYLDVGLREKQKRDVLAEHMKKAGSEKKSLSEVAMGGTVEMLIGAGMVAIPSSLWSGLEVNYVYQDSDGMVYAMMANGCEGNLVMIKKPLEEKIAEEIVQERGVEAPELLIPPISVVKSLEEPVKPSLQVGEVGEKVYDEENKTDLGGVVNGGDKGDGVGGTEMIGERNSEYSILQNKRVVEGPKITGDPIPGDVKKKDGSILIGDVVGEAKVEEVMKVGDDVSEDTTQKKNQKISDAGEVVDKDASKEVKDGVGNNDEGESNKKSKGEGIVEDVESPMVIIEKGLNNAKSVFDSKGYREALSSLGNNYAELIKNFLIEYCGAQVTVGKSGFLGGNIRQYIGMFQEAYNKKIVELGVAATYKKIAVDFAPGKDTLEAMLNVIHDSKLIIDLSSTTSNQKKSAKKAIKKTGKIDNNKKSVNESNDMNRDKKINSWNRMKQDIWHGIIHPTNGLAVYIGAIKDDRNCDVSLPYFDLDTATKKYHTLQYQQGGSFLDAFTKLVSYIQHFNHLNGYNLNVNDGSSQKNLMTQFDQLFVLNLLTSKIDKMKTFLKKNDQLTNLLSLQSILSPIKVPFSKGKLVARIEELKK